VDMIDQPATMEFHCLLLLEASSRRPRMGLARRVRRTAGEIYLSFRRLSSSACVGVSIANEPVVTSPARS